MFLMSNSINVLVIEDDEDINNLLCHILMRQGYLVKSAYSGSEAKIYFDNYEYQIILMDLMIPGISGEKLIDQIRKNNVVPIIVISAKTALEDKVNVLKLGADDFIVKPFETQEVIARIEAQLRRYMNFSNMKKENNKLEYKNLTLDKSYRQVNIEGNLVNLTVREFDILEILMSNPKKVFTRANIFESVWKNEFLGDDNTVNVHVSNLRAKLSVAEKNVDYIQTVWGIGFKLKE